MVATGLVAARCMAGWNFDGDTNDATDKDVARVLVEELGEGDDEAAGMAVADHVSCLMIFLSKLGAPNDT